MTEIINAPFPLNAIVLLAGVGNLCGLIGGLRLAKSESQGIISFLLGFALMGLLLRVIIDAVLYGTYFIHPVLSFFLTIVMCLACISYGFGRTEDIQKMLTGRRRYVSRAGNFSLDLPEGWVRSKLIPSFQNLGGVAFTDRKGASANISFGALEANQSIVLSRGSDRSSNFY